VKRSDLLPRRIVAGVALFLAVALPAATEAQSAPDFLFRMPRVSLGLRVGYAVPLVSSDIFDDTRDQLTVESRDFYSPSLGGQLSVRATPRVDIAFDVTVSRTDTRSEYRDWVDTNDLPIEQVTKFQRIPAVFSAKVYLADRGRSVGRFAWIPASWTPFVGAGAGWVFYRFERDGDFVDFETLDIYTDRFVSEGSTPTIHVYGGADWSLSPTVFLTAEGRYAWGRADMGYDFVGFDPMDLSGFQVATGISIRF
jgi:hypothetical protein